MGFLLHKRLKASFENQKGFITLLALLLYLLNAIRYSAHDNDRYK